MFLFYQNQTKNHNSENNATKLAGAEIKVGENLGKGEDLAKEPRLWIRGPGL